MLTVGVEVLCPDCLEDDLDEGTDCYEINAEWEKRTEEAGHDWR